MPHHHAPVPVSKTRVLNARLSDEALTNARVAALLSNLCFKDYLDHLLRHAKPIESELVDNSLRPTSDASE